MCDFVLAYGIVICVPSIVCTARLGNAGSTDTGGLLRLFSNHRFLDYSCKDLVVFTFAVIREGMKLVTDAYIMKRNDEVSETLGDTFSSDYYAWDSQPMILKPSEMQNTLPSAIPVT